MMNSCSNPASVVCKRMVAAISLGIVFLFPPVMAFSSDKDFNAEHTQHRIEDMHKKLKITTAQEEQWAKVAQVMRENAKSMDALTQSRVDNAKGMTAIEDLNSYREVSAAHLDGVNKLIPVFSTLYGSMSDPQKKEADELFRHGDHKSANKKL